MIQEGIAEADPQRSKPLTGVLTSGDSDDGLPMGNDARYNLALLKEDFDELIAESTTIISSNSTTIDRLRREVDSLRRILGYDDQLNKTKEDQLGDDDGHLPATFDFSRGWKYRVNFEHT